MRTGPAASIEALNNDRLAFAVAYSSLLAFAFAFQSLPPVLSLILKDLRLDHAQGGLLMGFFALPGILLTIPGGWLADRYGSRRVAFAAAVMTIFGTLIVAAAPTFTWLAIGRLISGMGAMTLIVTAAGLVSLTFRGPRLGRAMGIYNTGMPLGTIICFNLLGAVGIEWGWRTAVLVSALPGFAAIAFLLYQPELQIQRRPGSLTISLLSAGVAIWLAGGAWLWFNAAAIAFLTFSPDYFMNLGFKAAVATFLASCIMWGALVVSPAIGPFMGDIRRKQALIAAGCVIPALVFLALPVLTAWQLPLVVILGLAAALVPAPLFALPAELVSEKLQGTAFGILSTCLNVGILLGPYLVGRLRDSTGSYSAGFMLMAAFSLLGALAVLPLFRLGKPAN